MTILAFTPLYDPLTAVVPQLSDYWLWLVVPLVLAIGIVYKGTRIASVRQLPKDVTIMSVQVMIVMVVAATLLAAGYWAYIRIPFLRP
jgi:hypothetical protein